MALTEQNIQELNNMNAAAQRAGLGTFLSEIVVGETSNVAPRVAEGVKVNNSSATSIKELVNDFNNLLDVLRKSNVIC